MSRILHLLKNESGSFMVLGGVVIVIALFFFIGVSDFSRLGSIIHNLDGTADLVAMASAREYANHRATTTYARLEETALAVLDLNPELGGGKYELKTLELGFYDEVTGIFKKYSQLADGDTDPEKKENKFTRIATLLDTYATKSQKKAPILNSVRASIKSSDDLTLLQSLFTKSGPVSLSKALERTAVAQFCSNDGSVKIYGSCMSRYSCTNLEPLYKKCEPTGLQLTDDRAYDKLKSYKDCAPATQENVCEMYPACGDRVYDLGDPFKEQCDTGLDKSHHCSSQCQCVEGSHQRPAPDQSGVCGFCGDGIREYFPEEDWSEQCDDANQDDKDVCTNQCLCNPSTHHFDPVTLACVPNETDVNGCSLAEMSWNTSGQFVKTTAFLKTQEALGGLKTRKKMLLANDANAEAASVDFCIPNSDTLLPSFISFNELDDGSEDNGNNRVFPQWKQTVATQPRTSCECGENQITFVRTHHLINDIGCGKNHQTGCDCKTAVFGNPFYQNGECYAPKFNPVITGPQLPLEVGEAFNLTGSVTYGAVHLGKQPTGVVAWGDWMPGNYNPVWIDWTIGGWANEPQFSIPLKAPQQPGNYKLHIQIITYPPPFNSIEYVIGYINITVIEKPVPVSDPLREDLLEPIDPSTPGSGYVGSGVDSIYCGTYNPPNWWPEGCSAGKDCTGIKVKDKTICGYEYIYTARDGTTRSWSVNTQANSGYLVLEGVPQLTWMDGYANLICGKDNWNRAGSGNTDNWSPTPSPAQMNYMQYRCIVPTQSGKVHCPIGTDCRGYCKSPGSENNSNYNHCA